MKCTKRKVLKERYYRKGTKGKVLKRKGTKRKLLKRKGTKGKFLKKKGTKRKALKVLTENSLNGKSQQKSSKIKSPNRKSLKEKC